uniref:EGF-like domain-containing protein n=2 Tax=Wuchereria bancrofti TaxID=6293 RepID=A0AAF5RWF0_WUCBA
MNLTFLTAKHLLILCCNGGLPFIDLQTQSNLREKHKSTYAVDPTDWIAVDTSGSELNLSMINSLSTLHIPSRMELSICDLFNLTFSDIEDEELFERSKGEVKCRCPLHYAGLSCEIDEVSRNVKSTNRSFFNTISSIILILIFGALLVTIMRCGFCDCFGPFLSHRKKDDLDLPLDQNALNRCLELVQAHEARQDNLLKSSEHQRPLISTVYEACAPPYEIPHNRNYRLGTPPPSYRSVEMQKKQDQIRNLLGGTNSNKNTRI